MEKKYRYIWIISLSKYEKEEEDKDTKNSVLADLSSLFV